MRVGNRLDINAYVKKNPPVHVDTVHDVSSSKNTPISYNRTGHLSDVEFSSNPDAFYRVGLGTKEQALTPMGVERGMGKTPQAMIKGTNIGTHDDEVRRMLAEMLQDPAYTQVGMDPRIGSQFYDKATDRPIWTAGEKFQSGPLVMVPKKDIELTDWEDPRLELKDFPGRHYAPGGLVGYGIGGNIIKGALSMFKNKADDVASKYHPLVQKGLAEGRIHPNDAQWMSDYAHTPGRAEVETGTGAFKDQSERMQNFVARMERGEVPIPPHMQGPGGVNRGANSSGLNPPIDQ